MGTKPAGSTGRADGGLGTQRIQPEFAEGMGTRACVCMQRRLKEAPTQPMAIYVHDTDDATKEQKKT